MNMEINATMATTTRFIGTCAACTHEHKVRDGKLVHHGYQRPGYGYIVGDCPGALAVPHELSPDLAIEVRVSAQTRKRHAAERLVWLATAATTLTVQRRKRVGPGKYEVEPVEITTESPEWSSALVSAARECEMIIGMMDSEIRRTTKLIDTWELKPLKTVEQEQVTQRAAKAEREATKVAKRQARIDKAVQSFQKRIDSALKTKNSTVLADIWCNVSSKLRGIDSDITSEGAVALLGRDHVWEAFGLAGMVKARWNDYSEQPYSAILRQMKGRMDRLQRHYEHFHSRDEWERKRLHEMSLAWPDALGGENAKGKRTLAEVQERLSAAAFKEPQA